MLNVERECLVSNYVQSLLGLADIVIANSSREWSCEELCGSPDNGGQHN